jgi:uncharacterized OB-fold protein
VTRLLAVATYRPAYEAENRRVAGPDEDLVTMAVSAAQPVLDQGAPTRLILVSRQLERVPTAAAAVISAALDLPETTPVEQRLGGAATAVEALTSAPEGALVLAVDLGTADTAAAAVTGAGEGLRSAGQVVHGMPVADLGGLHDDARLLRERAWRPAAEKLARGAADGTVVTGIPARIADGLVRGGGAVPAPPVVGAPAPLCALADLGEADRPARVIGLEGGDGAAADLTELGYQVTRVERSATVAYPRPPAVATSMPLSLSAYERAFEAKVGLRAGRCECGELSLPPRRLCLNCGRQDAWTLVRLPDRGEVYSTVTIHAPLPGKKVPYSIALVALDGVPLRVLAPVTDAVPGSVRIGDAGRLVLRLVAEREGIADYGYAFQPEAGA